MNYYKVVVLKVGLFETVIINERHFGTHDDARLFAEKTCKMGLIPVIIII